MSSPASPLLQELEKEIATLLVDKLEHEQITLERAAQIARFILAHLPVDISNEQIRSILPDLDDEFTELAGIVHQHLLTWEEEHKEETIQSLSKLIKNNHFDRATEKAKGYFEKKFS